MFRCVHIAAKGISARVQESCIMLYCCTSLETTTVLVSFLLLLKKYYCLLQMLSTTTATRLTSTIVIDSLIVMTVGLHAITSFLISVDQHRYHALNTQMLPWWKTTMLVT